MLNTTILTETLDYAHMLSQIPNAPFLHGPLLQQIITILSNLGITPRTESSDFSRGIYALDDYCLYVRFQRGKPTYPLLLDSHLDHPAFVLDGRGRGAAFGSIGFERISHLLKKSPLDLRIFAPSGEFITIGKVTNLEVFTAQIETSIPIPPNSHGVWNVPDFQRDDEYVWMYSADNMIVTDLMLALITQVARAPQHFPDLDVTFVFTFLEEVFEVSASALSMTGHTPFGALDERSIIIVLESMEAVPLMPILQGITIQSLRDQRLDDDSQAVLRRIGQTRSAQSAHPLYQTLGLALPDSEAGVVIKVNDMDCVYGYGFPDRPNLAELCLLTTAEELGLSYQHTLCGGACNGTAYSLFPTTSHIATLSVPNPFKHNIHFDGSIVAERVKLSDVESAAHILLRVLQSGKGIIQNHPKALSERLKRTDLVPRSAVARRLRAERGSIAWSVQPRLRKRRFFGENTIERLQFRLHRAASRVQETMWGLMG